MLRLDWLLANETLLFGCLDTQNPACFGSIPSAPAKLLPRRAASPWPSCVDLRSACEGSSFWNFWDSLGAQVCSRVKVSREAAALSITIPKQHEVSLLVFRDAKTTHAPCKGHMLACMHDYIHSHIVCMHTYIPRSIYPSITPSNSESQPQNPEAPPYRPPKSRLSRRHRAGC